MSEYNYLLSIIIPTYNSEKYISRTLDLLISQGIDECEVIVVDDGSSDDTKNIVTDYERKYKNIILVLKEHSGVSDTRNEGTQLAHGMYIYYFDSDDSLEDGTLSFFKECIRNNSTEILAFSYKKVFFGKKTKIKKFESRKYDEIELCNYELKKAYFGKFLSLHICSFLISRSFIINKNLSFTSGVRIAEDVEFIVKAIYLCESFKYFNRFCYKYIFHQDSTFGSAGVYTKEYLTGLIRRIDYLSYNNIQNNPYINLFIAYSYLTNLYNCIKKQKLSMDDEVYSIISQYHSSLHKKIKGILRYSIIIKLCSLFSFNNLVKTMNRFLHLI